MQRSTGSYELVLSPLLLALIGFAIDGWLGTRPVVTIVAAVFGLAGAIIKIYYRYTGEMDAHEADAPWKPAGRIAKPQGDDHD